MLKTLTKAVLLATLALAPAHASAAAPAGPIKVVVYLENGVGGARAQQYLDRLLAVVAKEAGFSAIESRYVTREAAALEYIAAEKPAFGLFSVGAFLALEEAQKLAVVGQATAQAAGGGQYFIVSKGKDLAACKGKALASNHLDDARFVEHVLFGGAMRLADFKATPMQRPVQTLKAVTRDEAACALIDDAQKATLASIDGGGALNVVWSSEKLPALPVVSLPGADAALVARFQAALPKVCEGDGKAVCADIGIQGLKASGAAPYAEIIREYRGKDLARP
ncbi:MAG: PhnD/SsuA/transferrin family substrate-binding protein [Myxococcales bacterium]|nr:PhnD/SsuA/transferrin family substrate-binding protein [Myxococcales bacterium]MCB9732035.1 PhnD/SsuA/transferrin family substrate-binding protein [Deltaproteobacteria bacterium]